MHNVPLLLPRSHCPWCTHNIAWFDNIPIISWFLLKGRCRHCTHIISPLYPIIEFLTAAIMLALLYTCRNIYFCGYFVFFSALIVTIRSDIETMLISRAVTLFLVPIGVLLSFYNYLPLSALESICGALCGYLYLYSVNYVYKKCKKCDGIGEGDFDLLALIGSFTGIIGVWFTVFAAALLGIVWSIPLLFWHSHCANTKIPFAPFLAGGAIFFVLLQKELFIIFCSL